ncbi:MAG: class I SAM-dependent methyltransferase [Ignavibacteriae bacterium]|nr:MAG: class I SAM-dependent methyltransferase [Ignavibacteriota bacterium]
MTDTKDTWFKSWFNTQDYLDLYKHRDSHDASKLVSLIFSNINIPKGSNVLDLACGSGRHSVFFAKKGMFVTGIDLSAFLIKQANLQLENEFLHYKDKLKFEIRDMREIKHVNEFELVVNLFSSFGYFKDDNENEQVIRSISKALKPAGYFVIDFLNREKLINTLVPYDIKRTDGKYIVQVRKIEDGFVEKEILIFRNSDASTDYPVLNHFNERIRLYSLEDFRKMFTHNGLNIINTFGNYDGSIFVKNSSERLIIFAHKP